jgi:hypothetical protein
VILLGAEFNAELQRGRQIQRGLRPHDKEPFLEPRDTRKVKHHSKERSSASCAASPTTAPATAPASCSAHGPGDERPEPE